MKTITVSNMRGVDIASQQIQQLFSERGSQVVVIKDAEWALTDLQRSTYWMWISDIAKDSGEDKDRIHREYKERFLLRIMARDDDGYREMAEAIKKVQRTSLSQYKAIREQVVSLTSITDCTTKQMWEYMQEVKNHAETDLNIRLRLPEDRRFERLGK